VALSTAFQYTFFYFIIRFYHTEGMKFNEISLELLPEGNLLLLYL